MTDTIAQRRVVANIALTLDGRITGADGNQDMGWVVPHALSDGVRDFLAQVHATASTALLGRVNAEGFAAVWPPVATMADADPRDRAFAQWLNDTEKVILSSTITDIDWENSRVVDSDTAGLVVELRDNGTDGDILILASVSIIMPLLAAGLIDRLAMTLCPEILGAGRELFAGGALPGSSWTLTSSKASDSGALALIYDRA